MRAAIPLLIFAVLTLVAYAPAVADSENSVIRADTTFTWPDRAENLQVLPEDTGPFELRQVMRGFTRALGVRCEHCHVGTEEMSLSEFDFVSDDNVHKNIAREMMRMTWAINNDLLANIDGLHEHEHESMRVTCYTCHRGDTDPETVAPEREFRPPPGVADEQEGEEHGDLEHENGEEHHHGDDG